MKIATLLACMVIISASANASSAESILEIYEALDKAENFAVCAVAANVSSPRDELLTDKYLVKFRKEKNVPSLIPDSLLLDLGKNWIQKNGYEDRMAEVYYLCQKDPT
tara:strand:+ start:361 stop:684 length:324 start_codon:yes stop_codon:yes gene_type:complete